MIHVDCRKYKNLNNDNSGCIFGRDSDAAIKKCANSGFRFYQPVIKNEEETDMGVVKCEKLGNRASCLVVEEFVRDGTDVEIEHMINQCDNNILFYLRKI